MAAATQIRLSISEYPRSSFRSGCDHVDNVIEERDGGVSTGIHPELNALSAAAEDAR